VNRERTPAQSGHQLHSAVQLSNGLSDGPADPIAASLGLPVSCCLPNAAVRRTETDSAKITPEVDASLSFMRYGTREQ